MRLLVLDHHDSYTANLLRILPIECQVEIVQASSFSHWADLERLLANFDAAIISPGPGHPNDPQNELARKLVLHAPPEFPIFGVCLGLQVVVTAFGGSVKADSHPRHGLISEIVHDDKHLLFNAIASPFKAIRYNSLVADAITMPAELQIVATSLDGGKEIVQAVVHRSRPIWAVQFHLESALSQFGCEIMANWLRSINVSSARPPYSLNRPIRTATDDSAALKIQPFSVHSEKIQIDLKPAELMHSFVRNTDCLPALAHIFLDTAVQPLRHEDSYRSFIALSTSVMTYSVNTKQMLWHTLGLKPLVLKSNHSTLFEEMSALQRKIKQANRSQSMPVIGTLGFVVQIGYEMKAETLELASVLPFTEDSDARLAWAPWCLLYDHELQEWTLLALVASDKLTSSPQQLPVLDRNQLDVIRSTISTIDSQRGQVVQHMPSKLPLLEPVVHREHYLLDVEQARDEIGSGNSYELCLVDRFNGHLQNCKGSDELTDHYEHYISLRSRSPAPYAAFLSFDPRLLSSIDRVSILSSSPERLLRISVDADGTRIANMRPIKGTRRRASQRGSLMDQKIAQSLLDDPKEMAEGLMIADLVSAELCTIGERGSLDLKAIQRLEGYASVWQLVSEVEANIKPAVDVWQAVNQVFPPGSMTGAPKLRSVEILERLEQNRSRGVYSGALGFIGIDGSCDLSVVIRTMVITGTSISLGAGGAITWPSLPQSEWEEVLAKAQSVAPVKNAIEVFTTALYDPSSTPTVHLWPRHYARLVDASRVMLASDLQQSPVQLLDMIRTAYHESGLTSQCKVVTLQGSNSQAKPHQVRISLSATSSQPYIDVSPLPVKFCRPVRIALAKTAICDSLYVRQKTSHRQAYDHARHLVGATHNGTDEIFDVLLYDNSGHITETSIANIAVQHENGVWITPNSSLPLLQGVMRAELLATGQIVEGVICVQDIRARIRRGETIACHCFNALRGVYEAEIVG